MCGIFGWRIFGKVEPERMAALATVLAIENDKRGGNSWGCYAPDIGVVKGLGKISGEAVWLSRLSSVMSHTRLATVGDVTVENSHPFEIGDIIGAHNGMISNHDELNKKYGRDFSVDSQHLIAAIAFGLDSNDIVGYGTAEWYDKNTGSIYICNVESGDLSAASIKVGGNVVGVAWSSAESALKLAIECSGIESFMYDVKERNVYECEKGLFDASMKVSVTPMWSGAGYSAGASSRGTYSSGSGYDWRKRSQGGRGRGWVNSKECTECGCYLDQYGECKNCMSFYNQKPGSGCGDIECPECPFGHDCQWSTIIDNQGTMG